MKFLILSAALFLQASGEALSTQASQHYPIDHAPGQYVEIDGARL